MYIDKETFKEFVLNYSLNYYQNAQTIDKVHAMLSNMALSTPFSKKGGDMISYIYEVWDENYKEIYDESQKAKT